MILFVYDLYFLIVFGSVSIFIFYFQTTNSLLFLGQYKGLHLLSHLSYFFSLLSKFLSEWTGAVIQKILIANTRFLKLVKLLVVLINKERVSICGLTLSERIIINKINKIKPNKETFVLLQLYTQYAWNYLHTKKTNRYRKWYF